MKIKKAIGKQFVIGDDIIITPTRIQIHGLEPREIEITYSDGRTVNCKHEKPDILYPIVIWKEKISVEIGK